MAPEFWHLCRVLFLLIFVYAWRAFALEEVIQQGKNESVRIPGVRRVAVADGKVAGVRAVSPGVLLITGRKPGKTRALAWDDKGKEHAIEIEVVAQASSLDSNLNERVLSVSLEFLEIDRLDDQKLGVRWPETVQFNASGGFQISDGGGSNHFSLTGEAARGWLSHLYREGHARVVARPELSVRVGEEAVFHSGGEFAVAANSETFGRSRRYFEWKGYGLTVKVRPDTKDGLYFRSDVSVDVSEINSATAIEGIPGLNKRSIITKINARENDPVILSGLVRHHESGGNEGVPGLKDLPILGALFQNNQSANDRTELILSITFRSSTRADGASRLERYRESVFREEGRQ